MFWVPVHDTLPDHPKVTCVADVLRLDRDSVVGKLVRLWTWAATARTDGFLADGDAEVIADVMRWRKSPRVLMDALCAVPPRAEHGLLERVDGGYMIHDWDEYAGFLKEQAAERREKTKQRVARLRERKKGIESVTCNAVNGTCNALQPHDVTPQKGQCNAPIQHNLYITPIVPTGDDADATPTGTESHQKTRFSEFWAMYPKKVGKGAAEKAYAKAKPDRDTHMAILKAVTLQKQSDQWRRDNGQYIPNPATWINQRRWEDEVQGPAPESPADAPRIEGQFY